MIRSATHTAQNPRSSGYSLIELMITVAIVGILSTVAVPSYQDYVTRGKIPEATAALSAKRLQMETYFMDNRTYVGAPACQADSTTSTYFDFSCPTDATVNAFTLEAVGKGAMAGFTFTVNQSNVRATTAVPTGWTTSTSCWVVRKGGGC